MSGANRVKTVPWYRFLITAAGTEAIYLLLGRYSHSATTSTPLVQTLPFFVAWTGLVLLYALAVHGVRATGSRSVTWFILATSLLFRASLVPANITSPPATYLVEPWTTPLGRAVDTMAQGLTPVIRRDLSRQALMTAADMAALALTPGLLKTARLPGTLCLIYGWNPLAVTQAASGDHLHSAALLLFVVCLRALSRNSRLRAAIAYGLSLTGSVWTFACMPFMARTLRTFGIVVVVIAGTFWSVNFISSPPDISIASPPFVGGSLLPVAASVAEMFWTRNTLYPFALCMATWLFLVLYRAFRHRPDPGETPREALWAIGTLLMVSPRVYPSLFIPIAHLSAFSSNRGWLVFTATAPMTYLAYGEGSWSGWNFWLGFTQYFPAYFALIFGGLGRTFRGRPT